MNISSPNLLALVEGSVRSRNTNTDTDSNGNDEDDDEKAPPLPLAAVASVVNSFLHVRVTLINILGRVLSILLCCLDHRLLLFYQYSKILEHCC